MQKSASERLATLLGIFLFAIPCTGQDTVSGSFYFTYKLNSSAIIPDSTNAAELARLDTFIRQALAQSGQTIGRIHLTSYSSVEGDYSRNEELSRERVDYLYHYLRQNYPALYRCPYNLAWVAEDWNGLALMVRQSTLKEKEEVLSIIRTVRAFDTRKSLLKRLNGGRPYKKMVETIFPRLRRVEMSVEYAEGTASPTASPQPSPREREKGDTTPDPLIYNVLDRYSLEWLIANRKEVKPTREVRNDDVPRGSHTDKRIKRSAPAATPVFLSLKTNLLLWAGIQSDAKYTTSLPNFAVEYFFSPHWSAEFGAQYGNWHYGSADADGRRPFQGITGYRLEARYYPLDTNRAALSPFIGIYGRLGDYNLREAQIDTQNSQLITHNSTGKYRDFGLSAGLYLRLYRGLGLEFGARGGYVATNPVVYTLHNGHSCYQYETTYRKFRITDLNVSLTYRFGR